jgi:SAM-dependent methyltransferase
MAKKSSRRSRRGGSAGGSGGGTGAPLPLQPDYSGFGPRGPEFQQLQVDTWSAIGQAWDALPNQIEQGAVRLDRPPMPELLARNFDRSGWLFERLMTLTSVMGGMDIGNMVRLWEALRPRFTPPLRPGNLIASDTAGVLLRAKFMETLVPIRLADPLRLRRWELNRACHGPMTEAEMRYMLRAHPRMLEIGCGSGYFAQEFVRRGGDIIAQDNNKYHLTAMEFPWTVELRDSGRLVITDDARELIRTNHDRTVAVFWPEPGCAWLSQIMEECERAGVQALVVKFGGLVGFGRVTDDPTYVPPRNAGSNVAWTFELLEQDWLEESDASLGRPGWNPWEFENNMFVFRRRTK